MKEIVTVKGVYTYDQTSREYTYKPHTQLAAEARRSETNTGGRWMRNNGSGGSKHISSAPTGCERWPYFGRRWW